MSDVFRNLKGTSKTEFRLGLANRGSGLYSGSSDPSGSYTVSAGDIWFDKNNQRLAIRTGGGAWTDVTNTSVVDNQISSTLSSDVTFGADVTITGDLTVNGTQTVINTETLNIADYEIVLNSDLASNQPATANAGILVNRGNEGNVFLRWDEGEGEWTVNGETFSAGALIGNLSGNVTGSIAPNGVPNVVRANTLIVNGSYTMPSADGSANQVLQTDGSGAISFANPQSTPGGANTQIQFNDAGSFNGNTSLTWNTSAERLDVKHLNVSGVFSRAVDYGGITSSADPANTYDYGDIGEVHEGTEFIVKDNPQLGGNLDAANYNIDSIGVATAKSYKDTVYTITDGASVDIDPDNGGIQVWTLGASRSPTANNFDAGAKVMLMINDGSSYTITWPSVNWVGGVAPTLASSGYSIVELWKVGTQLYGAFAGGVA